VGKRSATVSKVRIKVLVFINKEVSFRFSSRFMIGKDLHLQYTGCGAGCQQKITLPTKIRTDAQKRKFRLSNTNKKQTPMEAH